MKKIIVLIIGLSLSLNILAVPDIDSTKVNEAERIIDKYSEKFVGGITSIVDKLEDPAVEVFKTVVLLQIIKGVACMISLFLACVVCWMLAVKYIKKAKTKYGENSSAWADDGTGVLGIVFMVGAIGTGVGFISSLFFSLSHIFAPEWYAIIEIINLVKPVAGV